MMKLNKTFLTLGLAAALLQMPASSFAQNAGGSRQNPLLQKSNLPFGAPDFSKIQESDYLPAIEAAIKEQRANIQKIVNKKKPTFQNTILAFEESGVLLDRVTSIFYGLTSAHRTPAIAETEKKATPMLTELDNEISFNQKLFERIKYVYDNEYKKLKGEDQRLTEVIYKSFVRSGALLSAEKMERMKQINSRISDLQQKWDNLLPAATNNAVVWVNSKEELAGLSEADIAQCKKDAESRGSKSPYCIVIINTTQQPILTNLQNRELRRKVYMASIHRADGTNPDFNTFPIVTEIAKLRAEKGKLMGYDNYADYSLEKTMAKNSKNVDDFLKQLIKEYAPKADAETKAIEEYAQKTEGKDFKLEPYDRFYYSAKMKKEMLNISDDEVKPYFNIDSVQVNGVFYAAHRVYGLNFKQRKDIPTYHPDMKVFEVSDKNGKPIALFYSDYFRRPTKRGGAWMSAFAKQSKQRGQLPIIYNVCNNAKAPEGQPSLITWDEVTTLFHEFGHALHGMLSDCRYNTLSGTAVARDFVEMPSQFNESFASIPEIFDHYARHTETGKPMPSDLKDRMLKSINFQTAYSLGENLAATCLDMAWHKISEDEVPSPYMAGAFEKEELYKIGLLNTQIPPRYSTSYFNHVWDGGYAAGYYSYLWTEVLAVNIADYFAKHGALDPAVGQSFRDKILSRGNTKDQMEMFTDFTGMKQPDASGFLKARGL